MQDGSGAETEARPSGGRAGERTWVRRLVRALPWILVALGITVRVSQWAGNLSFEMAEAALAVDLIESTPAELLKPLARDQGAPLGFLLAQKAVIEASNAREPTLRLLPLACGIVAMIAFPFFGRRYVHGVAGMIALGLFAVLPGVVLASRLAKQYSGDIAVAVLLLWGAARFADSRARPRDGLLFGLGGAAALCFSHPAAFVLSGTGAVLGVRALAEGDRRRIGALAITGVCWAASFLALYFISLRHIAANEYLVRYWTATFAPIPPTSLYDFHWFPRTFVKLFEDPAGMAYPGLAAALAVLGFVALFGADRWRSLLLVSPAVMALLASALHRYPFGGHLVLFLVPCLLLLVGEGVEFLRRSAGSHGALLTAIACAFLFYDPVLTENRHLFRPEPYQEARPVVEHLKERWREGDLLYLYSEAQYPFEYYSAVLGFHPRDIIIGKEGSQDWDEDMRDIERMRGRPRVWLLFLDPGNAGTGGSEDKFFLFHLDRVGRRLDSLSDTLTSVHLYDLSEAPDR